MYISKELRKKNIAEYLLYMWQVEDQIRANDLSLDKLKGNIIDPYKMSEEQKKPLIEWYGNLIEMMRTEGVAQSGHLQINKNTIIMLTDLHLRLL